MKKTSIILVIGALIGACSPIKSTSNDSHHQLELTLHDIQTNMDDLRHDVQTVNVELQILNSQLNKQDDLLARIKQQDIETQKNTISDMQKQVSAMQNSLTQDSQLVDQVRQDIRKLSGHANETTNALSQHKQRLNEVEKEVYQQTKNIDNFRLAMKDIVVSMKSSSQNGLVHKVRSGDSLGKISKNYKVSVEAIKRINQLDTDLIVEGQELKIPSF